MARISDSEAQILGLPPGVTPTEVVEATGSSFLVLPAGIQLSACTVTQVGDNLVVTEPNGPVIVMRGYFDSTHPAKLLSPGCGNKDFNDTTTSVKYQGHLRPGDGDARQLYLHRP